MLIIYNTNYFEYKMPKLSTDVFELIQYYKENDISNYPVNKNKLPDMRKHFNKHQLIKLKKQKEDEEQKKKVKMNIEYKLKNYQEDTIEECIICYEKMDNNISILPCGHTCCVSCLMLHARENNNCPICRKELCIKPKKIEKMPEQILSSIISNEFSRILVDRRGMNLKNYIKDNMYEIIKVYERIKKINQNNPFNPSNCKEIENLFEIIFNELYKTHRDVGDNINDWYS